MSEELTIPIDHAGEAKDKVLWYKARVRSLGKKMAFLQLQMNTYKKHNLMQATSLAESQVEINRLQALLAGCSPITTVNPT